MKTTFKNPAKKSALVIAFAAIALTFSLNTHAATISDTTKMAKKKMDKMGTKMKKEDKMGGHDKMGGKMGTKMKKDTSKSASKM